MRKILLAILCTSFVACSERSHNIEEVLLQENNGATLECAIIVRYLNQDGEDLLDPTTQDYYSFDNMKLYYLINGERVEARDSNPLAANQSMLRFIEETDPYSLMAFTYHEGDVDVISEDNGIKKGASTAYLVLNENDTDTIMSKWVSGPGYFLNTEVWYNGQLPDLESTTFIILKE